MQTTLLGFAIAIILALLAALVGPLFIDWGSHRAQFEAHARQLTGLEFRVTGPIDARLLPTPSLVLQGIEFGRPDEDVRLRARALRIEFALGSLVRGEWRIRDAELEGPDFAAGLDEAGRLAWPIAKIEFNPEGVAIERLNIRDGRVILSDAASGARLVLDKLDFRGELRSLAGPIKGEGSVVVEGQHLPYRVATGRIAEDAPVRVRLAVDPSDRALTAEADVSISVERGAPRFEGNLQFARAVGRAPAGAQALIIEPWRLSGRVRGDGAVAQFEQVEFQYGPDERATKLRGNAELTFGRRPEFAGSLSSPQIDLDRLLALPETERRRPLAAVKALAESFTGTLRPPIATTLAIGVDAVTLGGATLQRVAAELKVEADRLDIKGLELRAPGLTQVHLNGRLERSPAGIGFRGSTMVDAGDPRALLAWLTGRGDMQTVAAGPMRLAGEVALGGDRIAVERLEFELDRMTVSGGFEYAWAGDRGPARLDATLAAPEIDLDRVHAVAKAALADAGLDWPREGSLSLAVARASLAGVEAQQADVRMRIDANGIEIDRLAIGDFGGVALTVGGRLDTRAQAPRGAMTVDLDVRALDGVVTLVEKLAPQAADPLRRAAAWAAPARLRASLAVDPGARGNREANARLKVDGSVGAVRVALAGDASAAGNAFAIGNLAALGAAKVHLAGRLDADDAGALAETFGLDRLVAVDHRPGRLAFTAIGPLDGQLAVEGQFGAGALDMAANGTVRLVGRAGAAAGASAGLDLKIANANIRSPRPVPVGRAAESLPLSLQARLAAAEGMLRLTGVKGTLAGTDVVGRLAIGMRQQPIAVDGDIEVGTVDLPAAIAALVGIPASAGASANGGSVGPALAAANGHAPEHSVAQWPAEPFEQSPHRLDGQISLKATRVTLTPKLAAGDVRAVLKLGAAEAGLQAIDGSLAGGRINGELMFLRRPEGLTARSHITLAAANVSELLPGDGLPAGRITLDAVAEGSGMSPVALVGALGGSGTFTLEAARLARLNPAAFDAIIRAVDQGLPIDAGKVRERMDAALASGGGLAIPLASGAITINSGQARLGGASVRAQGADLAVSGSVNLTEGAVDARLAMSGPVGGPADTRPEVVVTLKGPIDTPKRTIDVAALASWLALRAVDQQSRKLDVLEGRAPPEPPAAVGAPASPDAARREPEPEPAAPRPPVRGAPKAKSPAGEQAQPLPPPIDIRPVPAPRTPLRPTATQAQQAKPPAPARPRSLSEILFGN